MHQVTENSSTGRVSVNKVWNMSELRRIDALALPLEQSVKLGMYFANAKMLVWKTKSPIARAKFIWSVLQLFASPLKRAPPLLRLKLLDLQTFAEESPLRFRQLADHPHCHSNSLLLPRNQNQNTTNQQREIIIMTMSTGQTMRTLTVLAQIHMQMRRRRQLIWWMDISRFATTISTFPTIMTSLLRRLQPAVLCDLIGGKARRLRMC